MSLKNLIPSYLDIDYSTFKQNFVNELQKLDSFKDYDFEGSNTSVLLEFFAYMSELNTYYLNKVAKNVYDETADLYENVHRIATFKGYQPKGYIAAQTDVQITIRQTAGENWFSPGDNIYVPAWFTISDDDGEVPYLTTRAHYGTIPTSAANAYYTSFPVKQGTVYTQSYTGADIVDNQIVLPFLNFDHDDNVEDQKISILVEINGIPWARIEDFYDDISGLQSINTVYTFNFDKYKRYTLTFSDSRLVPNEGDTIEVTLVKTLAEGGNVGAGLLTKSKTGLVYNVTKKHFIPIEKITITNLLASDPGAPPQETREIKKNSRGFMNAQYRCVTRADYITFLEARTDVVAANCWGESELYPEGMVSEYNKVHLTAIPSTWSTSTVPVSAGTWTPFSGVTGDVIIPYGTALTWQSTLRKHLEPRKMFNTYEMFEIPELIYFALEIGIRIKRSYNFIDVLTDVRSKLAYYFDNLKTFGMVINFLDLHNYMMDITEVSPTDSFKNIKGIDNFIIRDIVTNSGIYSYNSANYPQYTQSEFDYSVDNKLKGIQLGYRQYPMFDTNLCLFTQEI